jgi:hypothetical protein
VKEKWRNTQPMMGLDRELEYSTTRPERKKDDGTLLDSNEYILV